MKLYMMIFLMMFGAYSYAFEDCKEGENLLKKAKVTEVDYREIYNYYEVRFLHSKWGSFSAVVSQSDYDLLEVRSFYDICVKVEIENDEEVVYLQKVLF